MYERHDHVHGLRQMHEFRKGKTWEELYGEEKANELKRACSQRMIGEKNPAYGKAYERGGRSKIQGVYGGIRFRSSYELSWLVDVLTLGVCVTVPKRVKYMIDGRQRTYLPDFQVGNVIIEIKPFDLTQHRVNLLKFEAAQHFYTLHGLEFRVVTDRDLKLLTFEQISSMNDVSWNKGAREYLNEQV